MRVLTYTLPALASAISLAQAASASNKIHWTGPCAPQNTSKPLVCGTVDVPLDYTNPDSNQTLTLHLFKNAATNKPARKSILFNFGGPGENSFEYMVGDGSGQYAAMLGHEYDLISFNVRGDSDTLPFTCYNDSTSRNIATAQFPLEAISNKTLAKMWTEGSKYAEECYSRNKETGGLIGTSFVARDMMQIVDALGEDGLLHYWGISYGTTLGAVVAAMFPDRMGSIVLDGVLNSHEYFHGYDTQMSLDTDKVFAGFCSGCMAAPDLCPLAQHYSSASELQGAIYRLMDTLRSKPIPLEGSEITYEILNQYILGSLYSTATWPSTSVALNNLLTGNLTGLASDASSVSQGGGGGSSEEETTLERLPGIKCSDKTMRAPELSQVQPYMEESWKNSKMGGHMNDQNDVKCAQWKMSAKERYNGDFHVSTRHPVLLVSNKFDPVTPLASAYNMSSGFEGSAVLVNDGYGHSCTAQPSKCTAKYIRNYFGNYSLPSSGTVCETSLGPFTTKSWKGFWS